MWNQSSGVWNSEPTKFINSHARVSLWNPRTRLHSSSLHPGLFSPLQSPKYSHRRTLFRTHGLYVHDDREKSLLEILNEKISLEKVSIRPRAKLINSLKSHKFLLNKTLFYRLSGHIPHCTDILLSNFFLQFDLIKRYKVKDFCFMLIQANSSSQKNHFFVILWSPHNYIAFWKKRAESHVWFDKINCQGV